LVIDLVSADTIMRTLAEPHLPLTNNHGERTLRHTLHDRHACLHLAGQRDRYMPPARGQHPLDAGHHHRCGPQRLGPNFRCHRFRISYAAGVLPRLAER
jgi:hypothetical protein